MSITTITTPTRPTEPTAPDYTVPDPQEAWERFDRLVEKALEVPKENVSFANNGTRGQVAFKAKQKEQKGK